MQSRTFSRDRYVQAPPDMSINSEQKLQNTRQKLWGFPNHDFQASTSYSYDPISRSAHPGRAQHDQRDRAHKDDESRGKHHTQQYSDPKANSTQAAGMIRFVMKGHKTPPASYCCHSLRGRSLICACIQLLRTSSPVPSPTSITHGLPGFFSLLMPRDSQRKKSVWAISYFAPVIVTSRRTGSSGTTPK